ncbi:MAG: sulfatase [Planctomycetes bacterium]|nr:sulfatase [Planctomycetota bacterium]
MNSRRRVTTALLACLALAACSKPQPKPVKHVIVLSIDTQRADRLGPYGETRPLTPAIDALAKQSVVFERCAAQASWTSPSMVSLMSGCYVAQELLTIPPDKQTLAECFQKAGWVTAGFVCNDILNHEHGFDRGCGTFEGELKPYQPNTPILEWLRAHKDEQSFAWIHLNEVHDEGYAYRPQPEGDWRKYRDAHEPFGAQRMAYYDELSQRLKLTDREASLARMQEEDGSYDDDVHYEDHRIGEILDELRKLGTFDDTLLVLCADHGEGLFTREQFFSGTRKKAADNGEPATLFNTLQMTHGSQVNTELIHVPLIVHAPGLAPGRVAGWVENVDIAPTLLELVGIAHLAQHQGQSLVPLLVDPSDKAALRPAVFSHSRYNDSVIDQDSFQLILASSTGQCDFNLANQLYDLRADPEARHDLAGLQSARASELSQLVPRRLREGLGGGVGPISAQTQTILEGLGYVGSTVETLAERFRPRPTAELLGLIDHLAGDCLTRREIAKVLEERSLSPEERSGVQNWLSKEGSPAVREILERILKK